MKTKSHDLIMQNKVFYYLAIATILLLSIPFLMMTFHINLLDPGSGFEQINWTSFDFLVMGVLIFATSSLFVFISRIVPPKYRRLLAIGFFLAFLWIWAELAVGIFTNWGS